MGCDISPAKKGKDSILFQSTHPYGVRREENYIWDCEEIISIHAPVWGATTFGIVHKITGENFNPRTRMGCDLVSIHL